MPWYVVVFTSSIDLIDSTGHVQSFSIISRRTDAAPPNLTRPVKSFLTHYGRTPTPIHSTIQQKAKGATVVGSPKAVAEQSDVVFVIVGYPSDVEKVVLGSEGVLAGLKPGGVVVDWCVYPFGSSV